jgi:hypothetical protein
MYPSANFSLNVDEINAKLTISSSSVFSLTFAGTSSMPFQNGMGYYLGFVDQKYSGKMSYTGETIINIIEANYIFLSLGSEYPVISHRYLNTDIHSFAKVLVNVPKNAVIFDNGTNVITKEYFFIQPTDLTSFTIQLLDEYGNLVNLNGLNFSFTLEITEVIDHALYKLYNQVSN